MTIEFVERPAAQPSLTAALRETARNGKAILGKRASLNGISTSLKKQGYLVHVTAKGAPEGMAFAWTTLIADEVTQ